VGDGKINYLDFVSPLTLPSFTNATITIGISIEHPQRAQARQRGRAPRLYLAIEAGLGKGWI
jgi:hypothetical protein